jgi:hypothetical protein
VWKKKQWPATRLSFDCYVPHLVNFKHIGVVSEIVNTLEMAITIGDQQLNEQDFVVAKENLKILKKSFPNLTNVECQIMIGIEWPVSFSEFY